MRRLLISLLVVAWPLGCGEAEVPPEERPMGQACEAEVQCASRICIGGGACADGSRYGAFCAGDPCEGGDCPIGDKCITLQRDGRALQVCIPTTICN